MTLNPPTSLLKIDRLEGTRFKPLDLEIMPGSGMIVHSTDQQALDELIDLIHGLTSCTGGTVQLFGSDPAKLNNSSRLNLSRETAYASSGSNFISNLKVWENLILPLQAHGLASSPAELDHLEELIVEAFAFAGFGEPWIRSHFHESTDRLSSFQKIICGLIRCHLVDFRLLLGDCLFGGGDMSRDHKTADMLNWIGDRHPDSGLLLIHHGQAPTEALGLSGWDPVGTVELEVK